MNKPLVTKYLIYGNQHNQELQEKFKNEMFSENLDNWLYNGGKMGEGADLGYYIGYEICKSFYINSIDKSVAIKEIIELDYSNEKAIENFLTKSKYLTSKN